MACGDQRRRMGNGSALEALCDDVLYKNTFTLLLTNLYSEGPYVGFYAKYAKRFNPTVLLPQRDSQTDVCRVPWTARHASAPPAHSSE